MHPQRVCSPGSRNCLNCTPWISEFGVIVIEGCVSDQHISIVWLEGLDNTINNTSIFHMRILVCLLDLSWGLSGCSKPKWQVTTSVNPCVIVGSVERCVWMGLQFKKASWEFRIRAQRAWGKATHVATLTSNSSPVTAWRQTPNISFKQLFFYTLADTSESMFLYFLSSSSVLNMSYWCAAHPGRHRLTEVIPECQPSSLPPQLLHLQGIFSSCSLWVWALIWEL